MAINYTIQADIVDIRSDIPKANDIFLVDSNVWFWLAYPTASQSSSYYQTQDYPKYVNDALANGSIICGTGISLAELAHQIEKTEYEIYSASVNRIPPKEYRHNITKEHPRIISEVQAAWAQVKSMAAIIPVTIDEPTTDAALLRYQTEKVDGYDLFILEAMKSQGVVQIITDDGDFATVPGIQVFTANRNVLQSAQVQGKIWVR
ncbi:MAG: PIN domain-containing protein [Candidatus Brocadiae bacterium]|nr:PIN domain-containing protein [Candidatus Brocadiia bacterium]